MRSKGGHVSGWVCGQRRAGKLSRVRRKSQGVEQRRVPGFEFQLSSLFPLPAMQAHTPWVTARDSLSNWVPAPLMGDPDVEFLALV